jgi:hypothetical protein
MARPMPSLASRFATDVERAVGIARAGELAWAEAKPGSITRRELRGTRIDVLYEMAYLRLFVGWEIFLEETFLRMMCGWSSPVYTPKLASPHNPFGTIASAKNALYDGRSYLLWHNPSAVHKRCTKWFQNGIHAQVIASNEARLEWFAAVRHRIAHGSDQVKGEMNAASVGLAGRRYPGAAAGRFLRDWHEAEPLQKERWLRSIADELGGLASQMSP